MKIVVVGETCADIFEYGKCTRLNPEAPTPVFVSEKVTETQGMAANVANNLAALEVAEVEHLSQKSGDIKKHRYVDTASNYILLRVDTDGPAEILRMGDANVEKLSSADVLVVSDYDKGMLDVFTLEHISKLKKPKMTFLDTKKPLGYWAKNYTWIKVNSKEYENPAHDPEFLREYGYKIIVTMGGKGARVGDFVFPGFEAEVKDVTGAGDSFLAAFVAAYTVSENVTLEEAMTFANYAASYAVSKKGVVVFDKHLSEHLKQNVQ
jgi:bifunctional ADP-heptose synthase (sugar kinase/adenylyltransferase)